MGVHHLRVLSGRLQNGSPYAIRPLPVCLSVLSCPVCEVGVLWPNTWMDQDETWHAGRPWPWPYCVGWGPSSPLPQWGTAPNFRAMCVVAIRLDGLSCQGDFVLDGDWGPISLPHKKEYSPLIFGPCVLWPPVAYLICC